jgi:hypothetical protein
MVELLFERQQFTQPHPIMMTICVQALGDSTCQLQASAIIQSTMVGVQEESTKKDNDWRS